MICPNCKAEVRHGVFECPSCKTALCARYREMWNQYKHIPVQCPDCGQVTDSLKVYRLPAVVVFIGIYARVASKGHIGCPSCMRKKILFHGMTYNIVTANLIWPFLILPWTVVNLLRTLSKGHSSEIIDHIDNQVEGV